MTVTIKNYNFITIFNKFSFIHVKIQYLNDKVYFSFKLTSMSVNCNAHDIDSLMLFLDECKQRCTVQRLGVNIGTVMTDMVQTLGIYRSFEFVYELGLR